MGTLPDAETGTLALELTALEKLRWELSILIAELIALLIALIPLLITKLPIPPKVFAHVCAFAVETALRSLLFWSCNSRLYWALTAPLSS